MLLLSSQFVILALLSQVKRPEGFGQRRKLLDNLNINCQKTELPVKKDFIIKKNVIFPFLNITDLIRIKNIANLMNCSVCTILKQ